MGCRMHVGVGPLGGRKHVLYKVGMRQGDALRVARRPRGIDQGQDVIGCDLRRPLPKDILGFARCAGFDHFGKWNHTGRARSLDLDQMLEAGASDYCTKDRANDMLLAAIRGMGRLK